MTTTDKSKSTSPPLSLYHLLDPDVLANPYPLYQRLRTEAPVHCADFEVRRRNVCLLSLSRSPHEN
jgi:hypothetical protein